MNTPRASLAPLGRRAWLQDLSLLLMLRAIAVAIAVSQGFSALSDDDYARVTIAQAFASAPKLDPSGSSWLPFPFWINGAAMVVFGPSFSVARGVSVVLSALSVTLAYASGRCFSLSRSATLVGAALVALLPHAVWLGYATVPDGYCGALSVFALATLSSPTSRAPIRLWGALVLVVATLSRYETWAVAFVFAVYCAARWHRSRRPSEAIAGVLALLGPGLWLLHGLVHHGHALFFVQRVAEYRQALGSSPGGWWGVLSNYPMTFLRAEPEVMSLLLFGLWKSERALPRSLWPLGAGLTAMFALLIAGDVRDGAPTHHAERPLLALWLGVAIVGGHWLVRAYHQSRPRLLCWAGLALVLLASRSKLTQREGFVDRSAELEMGQIAKALATPGKLVIDSADFGYFAVIAGFEAPGRAHPLETHDPRQPATDPWQSPASLRQAVSDHHGRWLVARRSKMSEALAIGRGVARTKDFALIAVENTGEVAEPSGTD